MQVLTWLKILVFLDFFAVSLVLPLISSYFRDAGLSSQSYGLITSFYSSSQLIGGIALGVLSDYASKRNILILSFVGSAISYFMVGFCREWWWLLFSRVLVGLVKQTMTTSTLVVAELTANDHELRTAELGRLAAMSSISFALGPSLGGILYHWHPQLPPAFASLLFVINALLCCFVLPDHAILSNVSGKVSQPSAQNNWRNDWKKSLSWFTTFHFSGLLDKLYFYVSSPANCLFAFRIAVGFVAVSFSARNIINYYEGRFGMETYQLGFLTSCATLASFFTQSFLIRPILHALKSESQVVTLSLLLLTITAFIEGSTTNFWFFFLVSLLPAQSLASLEEAASKALFISYLPAEHLGAMLSLANVATSLAGIVAPVYGAVILSYWPGNQSMKGYVTAVHYFALTAVAYLLGKYLPSEKEHIKGEAENEDNASSSEKHKKIS
eukprot:gene5910-6507_t